MPKKWQHYVPQVYLRSWESTVKSPCEPNKPKFQGMYIFNRKNIYHPEDARSTESILVDSHKYTIIFGEYIYILNNCPKILDYFVDKIMEIFLRRSIHAEYKNEKIMDKRQISTYFLYISEWEFYYIDTGEKASKKSINNEINNLSCYLIEDAFCENVEKHWNDILRNFLKPVKEYPFSRGTIVYQTEKCVLELVEMLIYTLCRNPKFDLLGLFPDIKKFVDDLIHKTFGSEGGNMISQKVRDGFWITEIYKSLFAQEGYFHNFVRSIKKSAQIMLLKVKNENEGCFVTTDNPSIIYVSNIELKNNSGLYFPLTPKYLVFIGNGEPERLTEIELRTIENNEIRIINNLLIQAADKTIVSNKRSLASIT